MVPYSSIEGSPYTEAAYAISCIGVCTLYPPRESSALRVPTTPALEAPAGSGRGLIDQMLRWGTLPLGARPCSNTIGGR